MPTKHRVVACLLSVLVFAACSDGSKPSAENGIPGGEPCLPSDSCESGWICHQGYCRQVCNLDIDCPAKVEACDDGVCVEVEDPECRQDNECTMPPKCQVLLGAECYGGGCHYDNLPSSETCNDGNPCTGEDHCDGNGHCVGIVVTCTTPPENECVEGDTVYRSYTSTGTCDQLTGDCAYTFNQIPCLNCRLNCMMVCEGIDCSDTRGGCRGGGYCNPLLVPAACEYTDSASDGTACFLPQDQLAPNGVCLTEQCVDCISESDCTNPPGLAECFTAACTGNSCAYTSLASKVCKATECNAGRIDHERVCGAEGVCPEVNITSCTGFDCNTDALTCRTTCTHASDCWAGWFCEGTTCVEYLGLGGTCSIDDDCNSDLHCENSTCCAPGETCCNGDQDCNDGYRCNTDAFQCHTECTSDGDCMSDYHCNEGVSPHRCAADLGLGEQCNDSEECQAGFHCGIHSGGAKICCGGEDEGSCCRPGVDACGTCEFCSTEYVCAFVLPGEDDPTNVCDITCTDFIAGWNGTTTQCMTYGGPSAGYGKCDGLGACLPVSDRCTPTGGSATTPAGSSGCARACTANSPATNFDTLAEVFFLSGDHTCPGDDICTTNGKCGVNDGQPCGIPSSSWTTHASISQQDNESWFTKIPSANNWYSDNCSGGSIQCDSFWLDININCSSTCGVTPPFPTGWIQALPAHASGDYHMAPCATAPGGVVDGAACTMTGSCGCNVHGAAAAVADSTHCTYSAP